MSDEHNRRATDSLIIEMHGMLFRLDAKLQAHMEQEDRDRGEIVVRLEGLEKRVGPLEDTQKSLSKAWAVFSSLGAAVLLGMGMSIWFWLKSKIAPHLPAQ